MTIFEEYVQPRISQLEFALELIPRKINYAMSRNDFARVGKLANDALEFESRLYKLRALEGAPDSVIAWHLASL